MDLQQSDQLSGQQSGQQSGQNTTASPENVAAVMFINRQGRILTVRKRDATRFKFPGGPIQPGEDAVSAAVREASEEIRVNLSPEQLEEIGTYDCAAANEPDRRIHASVYLCRDNLAVAFPGAEIVELAWVSPRRADVPLAPLLKDFVFPELLRPKATA